MMYYIRGLIAKNRFTQIILFGMLALGIIMKPVLFSIGEIHELQHDPMAAYHHADLSTSHVEDNQNLNQNQKVTTKVLHILTHYAHSGDQPTLNENGSFANLDAALSRNHIPTLIDAPLKTGIPSTLFRPPISI